MSARASDRERLNIVDQLVTAADVTAWNITSVHRRTDRNCTIHKLESANTLNQQFPYWWITDILMNNVTISRQHVFWYHVSSGLSVDYSDNTYMNVLHYKRTSGKISMMRIPHRRQYLKNDFGLFLAFSHNPGGTWCITGIVQALNNYTIKLTLSDITKHYTTMLWKWISLRSLT